MGFSVRVGGSADFAAVGRLTLAAYQADGQLDDAAGNYADMLVDVVTRAREGALLVAVDDKSGEVLGSVTFCVHGTAYAQVARAGEAEFRMLAVDPRAQGTGVGEALVRACLASAETAGCAAVAICTRDFAHSAQRLYARLGFERDPERDWSPGPGVNLLALRVKLPAPTR